MYMWLMFLYDVMSMADGASAAVMKLTYDMHTPMTIGCQPDGAPGRW